MSKASKAAEKFAYTDVKQLLIDGIIPSDAGTLEIAEYSHSGGARALLEWARSLQCDDGGQCMPYVTIDELEAYFEDEEK